jgi:hypothetical protein
VVLEIGAGVVVPSIRMEGESLGSKGKGLIRVNPSIEECAGMSNGRLMEDLPIGEAYLPLVARSDVALKGLCQRLGLTPALASCEGYTVQLQQAQEAEEEESASAAVNSNKTHTLTPVFLSNSSLSCNPAQHTRIDACCDLYVCVADFFEEVPLEVRDKCILFFGSESHRVFGKAGPEYDEFIRQRQAAGMFHSLKPEGWEPGQPCDFKVASRFLNQLGYNPLHLDMEYYQEHLCMDQLLPEAEYEIAADKESALLQIEANFEQAVSGTGFYGHDYGPVLQVVRMSDERLYPILSDDGLRNFLELCASSDESASAPAADDRIV